MKQKRRKTEPTEMIYQTRHFRRDLHARLHIVKARINGQLQAGHKPITLDEVLNRVVEQGLRVVEEIVQAA